MGVDSRDRRLIGNLYMGQKIRLKIEGELSEPGSIGKGVRQGCPLSPILFNPGVDWSVQTAREKNQKRPHVTVIYLSAVLIAKVTGHFQVDGENPNDKVEMKASFTNRHTRQSSVIVNLIIYSIT